MKIMVQQQRQHPHHWVSLLVMVMLMGIMKPALARCWCNGEDGQAVASKAKALSLDQVRQLIAVAPDTVVAGEIRERGLAFRLTPKVMDHLHTIGAGSETAKVLNALMPANSWPALTLKAERTELIHGESITIVAEANDLDDDLLQYRWFTSAGSIVGEGPTVELRTESIGLNARSLSFLVGVEVADGRGGVARQALAFSLKPPNRVPTVSLRAEKRELVRGEELVLHAEASDPDGDPLEFQWSATGGTVDGDGQRVTLKTEKLTLEKESDFVTVTLKVTDGSGGTATDTLAIRVRKPKPIAVTPAEPIKRVTPQYPVSARALRLTGQVVVEVTIDERGDVVAAEAVEGPPLFWSEAVAAIKLWKFRPAMQGNQPVKSTKRIGFSFTNP